MCVSYHQMTDSKFLSAGVRGVDWCHNGRKTIEGVQTQEARENLESQGGPQQVRGSGSHRGLSSHPETERQKGPGSRVPSPRAARAIPGPRCPRGEKLLISNNLCV